MSPEEKIGIRRSVLRKRRLGMRGNLPDLLRTMMKRNDEESRQENDERNQSVIIASVNATMEAHIHFVG